MKDFPNGFISWQETYFEVVDSLSGILRLDSFQHGSKEFKWLTEEYDNGGRGRMYELAEEWTDEFEKLNEDREWDGQFYDELDEFLKEKIK